MRAQLVPGKPLPEETNQFRLITQDGVNIYVHHTVAMVAPVIKIGLGGFWKFRWLTLSGAAAMSACAV